MAQVDPPDATPSGPKSARKPKRSRLRPIDAQIQTFGGVLFGIGMTGFITVGVSQSTLDIIFAGLLAAGVFGMFAAHMGVRVPEPRTEHFWLWRSGFFALCLLIFYGVWYAQGSTVPAALLHISKMDPMMGSQKKGGPLQPWVNVYYQNDSDADTSTARYWNMAVLNGNASLDDIKQNAKALRALVISQEPPQINPSDDLNGRESQWFTMYGPNVTPQDVQALKNGRATLLFGGYVYVKRSGKVIPVWFCGFWQGGATMICPTLDSNEQR